MRDDEIVQRAVGQLFLGSVPEREQELSDMWGELDPVFQLTPDDCNGERVILDAGAYRYVRFNHRVLRAFWIAGYAAWEGYKLIAESPDVSALSTSRFEQLVKAFEDTVENGDPSVTSLPPGVAEPGEFPDKELDSEGRAAAELATIAVAWALLHELRHIRHQRDGTGANPSEENKETNHHEEFSCDEFATEFLLERADEYATSQDADVELVIRKRQLGIYFAMFAITLLAKDKWDASDTHPSVQARIDAVREQMKDKKSEVAAGIAHAAFAVLDQQWSGVPNPY